MTQTLIGLAFYRNASEDKASHHPEIRTILQPVSFDESADSDKHTKYVKTDNIRTTTPQNENEEHYGAYEIDEDTSHEACAMVLSDNSDDEAINHPASRLKYSLKGTVVLDHCYVSASNSKPSRAKPVIKSRSARSFVSQNNQHGVARNFEAISEISVPNSPAQIDIPALIHSASNEDEQPSSLNVVDKRVSEDKMLMPKFVMMESDSSGKLKLKQVGEVVKKCVICGLFVLASNPGCLEDHILSSHPQVSRKVCRVCNKPYLNPDHMRLSHPDVKSSKKSRCERKRYPCSVCGRLFQKSVLDRHLLIHLSEKPYECHICSRRFSFRTSLVRHELLHSEVKPYLCQFCGRDFTRKEHLENHMQRHHDAKNLFVCDWCHKAFSTRKRRLAHMKCHTSTGAEPSPEPSENEVDDGASFLCDVCGKDFVSRRSLKYHEKQVHSDKLFQCQECCKKFSTASSLKQHVIRHTDLPQECAVCQKVCKNSSTLDYHMLTKHDIQHGKYPLYKCSVCDKTFVVRSLLHNHLKKHTGEVQFGCKVCNKSLTSKHALVLHEKTQHEGVRSFQCAVCGKYLGRPSNLRRHMLTHTSDRPYACSMCEKTYRDNFDLRLHRSRVHGTNEFSAAYIEMRSGKAKWTNIS